MRRSLALAIAVVAFAAVNPIAQTKDKTAPPAAQQKGKKEYAFRGKVQKVDEKAKALTVDGENVEGWMSAMSMVYTVDKPEALKTLKAGDQITAKVYDGDFKTLYDVKVVPPKK
jgi:Cu/Ag efflux protein CusF